MPLTNDQRLELCARAMAYRDAVLLVTAEQAWRTLLSYVEELTDAQHASPQVPPTAARAEGDHPHGQA